MKQHITVKQWNELSVKGKKEWNLFWIERDCLFFNTSACEECGNVNLPNIGQLIEFLDYHLLDIVSFAEDNKIIKWEVELFPRKLGRFQRKELVDALWQATKEKLEK